MSGGSTDQGCLTQPGHPPPGVGWGTMRLLVPALALGSWGGSAQHSTALWQDLGWLPLAAQLHSGCATAPTGLQHGWDHVCLQCHHNAAAEAEHHFLPLLLLQKGDGGRGAQCAHR